MTAIQFIDEFLARLPFTTECVQTAEELKSECPPRL